MTDFLPSPDFVEKTMSNIRKTEEKRFCIFRNQAVQLFVTYAGAGAVILAGIVNLIRILATVFIPLACH